MSLNSLFGPFIVTMMAVGQYSRLLVVDCVAERFSVSACSMSRG
jgi:hypothetical protein